MIKKNKIKNKTKNKSLLYISIIVLILFVGLFSVSFSNHRFMGMSGQQNHMVSMKSSMQQELIDNGNYRCCIKNPCSYCLIKEGECDCLEELVNGESPCSECVGEILEGEGNPFLKEYFVDALTEELGEDNRVFVEKIIKERY